METFLLCFDFSARKSKKAHGWGFDLTQMGAYSTIGGVFSHVSAGGNKGLKRNLSITELLRPNGRRLGSVYFTCRTRNSISSSESERLAPKTTFQMCIEDGYEMIGRLKSLVAPIWHCIFIESLVL